METEIIWAAGFFDGEGCCFHHSRRSIRLTITQAISNGELIPEVLLRFSNAFGNRGNFYYSPQNLPRRNRYLWYCDSKEDVKYIIDKIYPYLSSVKKKQIDLAKEKADSYIDKPIPGAKFKDKCIRGHKMSETRKRKPNGKTYCSACVKEYNKEKKEWVNLFHKEFETTTVSTDKQTEKALVL